jgi:hypothetical protein
MHGTLVIAAVAIAAGLGVVIPWGRRAETLRVPAETLRPEDRFGEQIGASAGDSGRVHPLLWSSQDLMDT